MEVAVAGAVAVAGGRMTTVAAPTMEEVVVCVHGMRRLIVLGLGLP